MCLSQTVAPLGMIKVLLLSVLSIASTEGSFHFLSNSYDLGMKNLDFARKETRDAGERGGWEGGRKGRRVWKEKRRELS